MSKIKILFVDDDPGVLRALNRTCIDTSWNIFTADSAASALTLVEKHNFWVIVSDMQMPNMDGAELFTEIAKIHPHTIRILLTGFSNDLDTARAINHGKIFNYLHKPWNNETLIQTIEMAIEYRKSELEKLRLRYLLVEQNKLLKSNNIKLIDLNGHLKEDVKQKTAEVQQGLLLLNMVDGDNQNLKQEYIQKSAEVEQGLIILEQIDRHKQSLTQDNIQRSAEVEQGLLILEQINKHNQELLEENKQKTAEVEQGLIIMQQINDQLKSHLDSTTQLLNDVVQMRENHAIGHSKRICEFATAIAHKIKLDDEQVRQITIAAYLHDIGTLGLKDDILAKPAQSLKGKNLELYQQHPILGETLLSKNSDLKIAAQIIKQHHEYLDGSGYPNALTAKSIHIGARIICLCSDYDAIISGRFFNKPMTKTQANEYLHKHKGSKYDLHLVEAFLDLINQGEFKDQTHSKSVEVFQLKPEMILTQDIKTDMGVILLPKGLQLSKVNIENIKKFEKEINHHLVIHIEAKLHDEIDTEIENNKN
ncbi:HD domain-containing phosphohydrolase [Marinicellulosiphila megalodicopiae]|uniref:HD domain-containing phosphohydrolase n=1 Tax=Marinicellulosiphila megalodicopiae TaxID=2724896 RepID=UPI003BAE6C25